MGRGASLSCPEGARNSFEGAVLPKKSAKISAQRPRSEAPRPIEKSSVLGCHEFSDSFYDTLQATASPRAVLTCPNYA